MSTESTVMRDVADAKGRRVGSGCSEGDSPRAEDDPRRFLTGAELSPKADFAGLTVGDYLVMIRANHHTIVQIFRVYILVER